ncbi:conserved hypothetical protein [Perkinsus marinus ATCC 50983]|uniref:Uncharacterized protein n=1 Tax=Perkinsus marinus (strain ATCC 50983 / TXsc) TaxID=423536 RepID=C5KZI3_PERM5|nr:conserved hypothetical protein [Perkinsus marinus ATCC 50983]EER10110.1 conserved hypothetical protein [Perkinsus marinus ATCC 50983]|eukprot:XP_002778315.1 conserved hypothetical protein [Perkinsus marinus ATCC 50983]
MQNLIRYLTNGCNGGACDAAGLQSFTAACGGRNPPSPSEDEVDEYQPVSEDVASDGVPEWNDLIVPRFDTASSSPSYHGRNQSYCAGDSFDGSTRAESPRDPSTTANDKRRLRSLVREFTARAMRGVDCWQVDLHSGAFHNAMYQLDRDLRRFILATDQPVRACPQVSCDVADIVDILRAEESLVTLEYPALQDALLPSDMSRLILLQVYHHGLEDIETVGLLESSQQARETFLAALNILQIYAQAAAAGSD